MSKFSLRFSLATLVCALLVGTAFVKADDIDKANKEKNRLQKGAGTPRYGVLNISNLHSWIRTDGLSNHSPASDNGLYYPRFTAWAIYQDGVMFGGKVYRDAAFTQPGPFSQTIRVGGANYATGGQAGRIIGEGATAVAQNPNDADVRMYRIRRDYKALVSSTDGSYTEELRRDAAESNEIPISEVTDGQMQAVLDQYDADWKEWPISHGAPFVDRNGNGVYDAPPAFSDTFTADSLITQGRDEPGVAGSDVNSPADQVLWHVYNDLNRSLTIALQGSEPMGIEVQKTMWGYKRADALGNLYFARYKITNKGGVDVDGAGTKGSFYIDSMYVAQWSDPDLGGAGDDLIGVDTLLSLGYVYNGLAIDLEYQKYNLPPPSSGYDFLAGPAVPSPGDSAVFDLKRVYDKKNLGMSGFSYFSAGAPISDPPRSYASGTIRWYKMMRGYAPIDGPDGFYPHPPGLAPGRYPLSGDVVTQSGFVDGLGTDYSYPPGDRRLNLATGPFTLAPGETQEVTVGTVVGLGSDRISSTAVLKFNDRFAQNTYDALFAVPKSPLAPDVKIAELDGEVILEWGSNLQRVIDVEQRVNNPGQYEFEGYNVYQLPSRGSSLSDGKRIATFDLPTDPAVVLDEQFDNTSGLVLFKPVQFGTNSGVKRNFKLDKDYVRDLDKLYNGQEYYVVVTAYAVAKTTGFLPAVLESSPTIYTVRPQVPFGKVLSISSGDTLAVTKSGTSDGTARPIVINPLAGTGDTYQVRFADAGAGTTTWSLVNTTQNKVILADQTNQSGDDEYKFVEGGIYLKVEGPPPGLKEWSWGPSAGGRFITWVGGVFGFEGFGGSIGWGSPRSVFGDGELLVSASELKQIEVRFTATSDNLGTFDVNDPNASYAYRYGRGFGNAPAKPEFAPFIKNTAGGYSFQDYLVSMPLAVYDVDANPPRRLAVGYLENNASGGLLDGHYWPPDLNGDNIGGSGPREWLFIMDDTYTGATPDPKYQAELIAGIDMRVMYYASWTRRNNNAWAAGQVFTHLPNRPNTPATTFTYTLPAPQGGQDVEKTAVEQVGVFPNPYYGFNPAETSRFSKFVTFNYLPRKATIRIFNLAGQLVRTMEKDDDSQFFRWNLLNTYNFPVASGMYIAHIDMPDLGLAKTLKMAIIQEQEVLDVY